MLRELPSCGSMRSTRWRLTTATRGRINRWVWRMPPPTMDFAPFLQRVKELLTWLGFANVVRAQDETVTSSSPDTVSGYILTRAADLYGRTT